MKTKTLLLAVVTLAIAIFAGCKKENSSTGPDVNEQGLISQTAKNWFESQGETTKTPNLKILGAAKPDWNNTIYYPGENLYLTHINLNKELMAHKYLAEEADKNGKITKGNYYIVLSKDKAANPEKIIVAHLFNNDQMPESFNGALLEYNLNNSIVFTRHFENGKEVKKTDKLITRATGKNKTVNPGETNYVSPDECEGEIVTIDWYWQTWINGELVYEEYLFSTSYCSSSNGGGGGGNSGGGGSIPPEQLAESILNVMQNNTHTTSQSVQNTIVSQDTQHRVAMYKWKCIAGTGWSIYSIERGTHKKKHNVWQWESLEHISTTIEGSVVGGNVTHSLVYANAVVGIYNAVMNLEIYVDMSTTVLSVPYHRYFSLNPSKSFNVNSSPFTIPGY